MREFLFGLAALPLLSGVALAAEPLSDLQMDRVSAGALSITINCPACVSSSSNTTSTTMNGVTVTTGTNVTIVPGTGGSTGGSSGSTGGSGGSTGDSGGSTSGSGGKTSDSGGTPETATAPKVTLPANLLSVISGTTGFGPSAIH